MPRMLIIIGILLIFSGNIACSQETEEVFLAAAKPEIQAQFKRIHDALLSAQSSDDRTNCEVYEELEELIAVTEDKGELVKQLAIFIATAKIEADIDLILPGMVLYFGELPSSVPIRVLAPYLDAENEKLRELAQLWFSGHDSADDTHGRQPFGAVDYYEYMHYVGKRLSKNEEIPTGFIEYIYEREPSNALLVFAYANALPSVTGGLEAIHDVLQARREGREKTPEEIERQRQAVSRQSIAKKEKAEILLAEHIVSNAIWLKENEFADRFQQALPEAQQELKKLAEHDQWWARLYAAEIMRRHRDLSQPEILAELSRDDNELVSKAAKSAPD